MRRDKCLAKWPILDAQVIAINCKLNYGMGTVSIHYPDTKYIDICMYAPDLELIEKTSSTFIFTLDFSLSLVGFYGLCFAFCLANTNDPLPDFTFHFAFLGFCFMISGDDQSKRNNFRRLAK